MQNMRLHDESERKEREKRIDLYVLGIKLFRNVSLLVHVCCGQSKAFQTGVCVSHRKRLRLSFFLGFVILKKMREWGNLCFLWLAVLFGLRKRRVASPINTHASNFNSFLIGILASFFFFSWRVTRVNGRCDGAVRPLFWCYCLA